VFIAGGAASFAFAAVLARMLMAGAEGGARDGTSGGCLRFFLRAGRGSEVRSWTGSDAVVIVVVAERVMRWVLSRRVPPLEAAAQAAPPLEVVALPDPCSA